MTMSTEKVPMLEEGHRLLEEDAKRLKLERPEIIEAMLADVEDRLARALVIDPTSLSGDKVVFGATVTLVDEDAKKIKYQLVGQTEADARVGRISYNSPLGRALIGRLVGEDVEVTTPSGEKYYEISKLEFI